MLGNGHKQVDPSLGKTMIGGKRREILKIKGHQILWNLLIWWIIKPLFIVGIVMIFMKSLCVLYFAEMLRGL